MRRHVVDRNSFLVVTLAILLQFAGATTVFGQQPDRSGPPPVGPAPELQIPPIERTSLANGLEILAVQKSEVPLVQINFAINAGTVFDPVGKEGLAAMTADLLDEGAGSYDALVLADAFEYLGARFSVRSSLQTTTVSLRVPANRLDAALELVQAVMLQPRFPQAELDRLRGEKISQLVSNHDNPNYIASTLFRQMIFGKDHPYGRSAEGSETSLSDLALQDVRSFYDNYYRPNNTSVIVVGDIAPAVISQKLEDLFSSWKSSDVTIQYPQPVSQVKGRTVYLVDKPGAAQSVIQIGRMGPPRSTQDFYSLQVLNTVLGGSFTSRLNQNLREDKGYTYGARSSFQHLPNSGAFQAGAGVQTSATAPALSEFMKELELIREPVPQDELRRARNFLVMRFPSGFQTSAGVASQIQSLLEDGLDESYLEEYGSSMLGVTQAAARDATVRYIDPDNLVIIVVGDRSVIEESVRDLKLGQVEILQVEDVLGPVPALDR